MNDMLMALRPRVSEKSYGLSQQRNTYMFIVPTNANKHTVADAVAAQFKVTVTNVNIANDKGKPKRTVRKGGRPIIGRRASTKRAYVTLKTGDSLPIFANEEDQKAKPSKRWTSLTSTKEKK